MKSSLTYRGDVSVKINRAVHSSHNAGSINLFDLFASFLISGKFSAMSAPKYLVIYKYDTDARFEELLKGTYAGGTDLALTTHPVNIISSEKVVREGTVNIIFTANIRSSDVASSGYDSTCNYCVGLIDSAKNHVLALSKLNNSDVSSLCNGGEMTVSWKMGISNE